ncbi:Retrovirus-related Pol polyprotein from transposon TNT 1-94 [Sesbania bispinosa]|nr:Retrovirus-related Pol polyprotein from transposon TNT 1-94 [Sesbania bispinosa]
MQVNGETNGTTAAAAANTGVNALSGLSSEQWQTLQDLLNSHKGTTSDKMTSKHSEWIIDTGASSHMTGNLNLLCGLRGVVGCPVRLPDGKQLMAYKEGTVTLNEGLKMENVLYVPTLSCNLLSISQLTDETTNCVVYFTNNLCVMQDCTSKMLIGVGERRDGLYFFKGIRSEKAHKASGTGELNLWHQCMGHPSFKVTKLASNMSERSDEPVEEGINPTPNVDTLEHVRQSSLEELGRGHRTKLPSVKLREYVTHTIKKLSPSPSPSTSQHSSGVSVLFLILAPTYIVIFNCSSY